jgi:hypothetical protein
MSGPDTMVLSVAAGPGTLGSARLMHKMLGSNHWNVSGVVLPSCANLCPVADHLESWEGVFHNIRDGVQISFTDRSSAPISQSLPWLGYSQTAIAGDSEG